LLNESVRRPNSFSHELCGKAPGGRCTNMAQDAVDVSFRISAQLIEQTYMQRLLPEAVRPYLNHAQIIRGEPVAGTLELTQKLTGSDFSDISTLEASKVVECLRPHAFDRIAQCQNNAK